MAKQQALMELAPGWDIKRVLDALQGENRSEKRLELTQFIKERYDRRFLEPITVLEKEAVRLMIWPKGSLEPSGLRPYGFAIMSLACQMIETLESYRRGIPTTNEGDFRRMAEDPNYQNRPRQVTCEEQDIPGTRKAFACFFLHHSGMFPNVRGEEFFGNVRNSLLHQSQTKNGWVINIHHPHDALAKTNEVYVENEKVLYRDSFVSQLRSCFTRFIEQLRQHPDTDDVWERPERKIWWIAWLSDPEYVVGWLKSNPVNSSGS
jgi:hypothetical protein